MDDNKTTTDVEARVTPLRGPGQANLTPVQGGRQPSAIDRVIEKALSSGANLDQLQQLLHMQERVMEIEARQAFVEAMAEFKQNPPKIVKDRLVDFTTRSGERTVYKHATLAAVCEAAIAGLARVGISHKWEVDQGAGDIKVTCVLTHRRGHSENTTIGAPADLSGKKNSIQSVGSTITYLQRYTLLAATGLAVEDENEDDGRDHADPLPKWVDEVIAQAEQSKDMDELRAVRKAALERCRKEQDRPAYEKIDAETISFARSRGWLPPQEGGAK